MKRTDILYSISVEDVQDVAEREYDRELNDREMELVAAKLGEYIDWYEAVNTAITEMLQEGNENSEFRCIQY